MAHMGGGYFLVCDFVGDTLWPTWGGLLSCVYFVGGHFVPTGGNHPVPMSVSYNGSSTVCTVLYMSNIQPKRAAIHTVPSMGCVALTYDK